MLLENARTITRKKLAAAALAGLLSAGALTAAGEAAQAQSEEGQQVVNREVAVSEDRDYTGLWGLLGLLGLAGLAGLRRKRDDNVDTRRAPSSSTEHDVRRGTVRDSEVVKSTEGRGVDGDKVRVNRVDADGGDIRRNPSNRT